LDQGKAFECDDDESGPVDFVDLMSSSKTSVFEELFLVEEKMSIWNEFVNCSEEEQYRILDQGVEAGRMKDEVDTDDFEELSMEELTIGEDGLERISGYNMGIGISSLFFSSFFLL